MAATLDGVRTAVRMTRTKVTLEDLRARVRAFEQQHPGYDRNNYLDLFRGPSGELVESAEFFEVSRLYRRLARAEKAA
jgi:hypothetical protein